MWACMYLFFFTYLLHLVLCTHSEIYFYYIHGFVRSYVYSEGPCTLSLYTLAPKSLYRKYLKAQVYPYLGTWNLRVCSNVWS